MNVNTLLTPESASESANQSYNLLAPQTKRQMGEEELAGWGKDLFGLGFKSAPTPSDQFEEDIVKKSIWKEIKLETDPDEDPEDW